MEIDDILLKSSPLYNFLEMANYFVVGSASWPEFDNAIKTAHEDLTTLGKKYAEKHDTYENPEDIDRILDIIEEILTHVEHLEELHRKEAPSNEMVESIEQIDALNLELVVLQDEIKLDYRSCT